jgi:Domain of unknown function (DUF4062)
MAFLSHVVKVMIASPGDVAEEREIAREVLQDWNCVYAEEKNLIALPVGWETHSMPEMGDRPQAIINRQILTDCDLLVAIFWTRLGSPTGKAASGTVEEIEEHLKAGKRAMLYFSKVVVRPDHIDQKQYAALKKFKSACLERGLVESYQSVDEFRDKLRRQFYQTMNEIKCVPSVADLLTAYLVRGKPDSPSLSDAALTLLTEAIADKQGMLLRTCYAEGTELHVNDKQLIENQDARTIALWDGAIQELEGHGLIQDTMKLNSFVTEYKVTNAGFVAADAVSKTQ